MDKTEQAFADALRISTEWRPSRQEIENLAIEQAALNGRDWIDCGAYEREAYMDEARKILGIDK